MEVTLSCRNIVQLNIMPRHTFLRTALTRERGNSPAGEMALEHLEDSAFSPCEWTCCWCGEGLALILRAQWPLCTDLSSHSKAQNLLCLCCRVLIGLSLSWPEASSSTWLIWSCLPFPKSDSKGWFCVGQMWKLLKKKKRKPIDFYYIVVLLGQQWLCNLDLKVENSMNALMSHQIPGFMGLFSFQNSKLSWFWRLTNILWMVPLFWLFFFFFMALTLKWIVQSSTCGSEKRIP